jgi:ubiquinone/menaquinone biosynthesis C-methylase UbiE
MSANPSNGRAADAKAHFFDRVASAGDAMRFLPGEEGKLERLRARLGDLRGQRVLEPGCGSGPLTEWLVRWVEPGGRVEAFDPSAAMFALCRQTMAGRSNVGLTQIRCEDALFPEGTFDRVVCFRVLPHFDELDPVLARFARWLRPGGRLHIVHWEGRERLAAIHAEFHAVAEDVLPPATELEAALKRHHFAIATWIDNADEVYLEAVRD